MNLYLQSPRHLLGAIFNFTQENFVHIYMYILSHLTRNSLRYRSIRGRTTRKCVSHNADHSRRKLIGAFQVTWDSCRRHGLSLDLMQGLDKLNYICIVTPRIINVYSDMFAKQLLIFKDVCISQ